MSRNDPAAGEGSLATAPEEQDASQSSASQTDAQESASSQSPQYVTMEQLKQMGLLTRQDLGAISGDIVQRVGQQTRALINQRLSDFQKTANMLQQSGHPLTEEAIAATRERIIQEGLLGGEAPARAQAAARSQSQAPGPEASAGAQDAEDGEGLSQWEQYVLSQVDEVFQELQVRVTPDDPEWTALAKALDDKKGSLGKVVRTAEKQALAKKQRLASESDTAKARAGSGGGKGPIPPGDIRNVNNSSELYEIGEQVMRSQNGKRA